MGLAVLDTNFILTCVEQKIDFFEWLNLAGFGIIIPHEVIGELKKFSSGEKIKLAQNSVLALKILAKNDFEKISLKEKNVDNGIVKFAGENPEIAVATLDREMKRKIKNRKIVIRGKKKLEIV